MHAHMHTHSRNGLFSNTGEWVVSEGLTSGLATEPGASDVTGSSLDLCIDYFVAKGRCEVEVIQRHWSLKK